MMADKIAQVLRDVPAGKLGVVFVGSQGPRLIGQINHTQSIEAIRREVDPLLLAQRLTATYISRGQITAGQGEGRIFVAAHG